MPSVLSILRSILPARTSFLIDVYIRIRIGVRVPGLRSVLGLDYYDVGLSCPLLRDKAERALFPKALVRLYSL